MRSRWSSAANAVAAAAATALLLACATSVRTADGLAVGSDHACVLLDDASVKVHFHATRDATFLT